MNVPSHSASSPKGITVESHGAKKDPEATKCVLEMLEAFGLAGSFTLTVNYADDGRSEWYGIRVKNHTHSGVLLVIQPRKGSSRFYDGYLASKEMSPYDLLAALHAKLVGQKRFRKDEWKDPTKVIPFEKPVPPVSQAAPSAPAALEAKPSEDQPPAEQAESVEKAVRRYAKEQEGRLLILNAVWERFERTPFSASDFCQAMGKVGYASLTQATLKKILKALTHPPFIREESLLDTSVFCLSDAGFRFLDQLFYKGALGNDESLAARQKQAKQASIKDQIAELRKLVAIRKEAQESLAKVQDEAALKQAELQELRNQSNAAQARLGELILKSKEFEATIARQDLIEAEQTLGEILGN